MSWKLDVVGGYGWAVANIFVGFKTDHWIGGFNLVIAGALLALSTVLWAQRCGRV